MACAILMAALIGLRAATVMRWMVAAVLSLTVGLMLLLSPIVVWSTRISSRRSLLCAGISRTARRDGAARVILAATIR